MNIFGNLSLDIQIFWGNFVFEERQILKHGDGVLN